MLTEWRDRVLGRGHGRRGAFSKVGQAKPGGTGEGDLLPLRDQLLDQGLNNDEVDPVIFLLDFLLADRLDHLRRVRRDYFQPSPPGPGGTGEGASLRREGGREPERDGGRLT
jgi:hypothetical protein